MVWRNTCHKNGDSGYLRIHINHMAEHSRRSNRILPGSENRYAVAQQAPLLGCIDAVCSPCGSRDGNERDERIMSCQQASFGDTGTSAAGRALPSTNWPCCHGIMAPGQPAFRTSCLRGFHSHETVSWRERFWFGSHRIRTRNGHGNANVNRITSYLTPFSYHAYP